MRLIELGRVSRPHGFRGEFLATTDNGRSSALEHATQVLVGESVEAVTRFEVLQATWMPKGWKLKLQGVESDAQAKSLRGNFIFVDRNELPSPSKNEYYIGDLTGCRVLDFETNMEIGILKKVETTSIIGANNPFQDRWIVSLENEYLAVPAVQRYVARVDVDNREIHLRNLSEIR